MASKKVIANLALGLFADTSELGPSLNRAGSLVQSETKKMGQSLKGVDKSARELAVAFKGAGVASVQSLSRISSDLRKTEVEASRLHKTVSGMTGAFKTLGTTIVAAVGVGSATQALKLADSFNVLDQRIKTATASSGDYKKMQEALFKVSQTNGVALKDTVSLFQSLARSSKELGATNAQMVTLSDTMQKLGVIGGSSSEEMSNALRQLSQSFAGGIVRAEEFNSIVENMPELAHRIALGMGVTDGKLRQLMLSGKLLSKDVFEVLLKQAPEIAAEFDKMPKSMERSFNSLQNNMGLAFSKIDKMVGATRLAVGAMDALGESIKKVGDAVASLKLDNPFGKSDIAGSLSYLSAGNFGLKNAGIDADAALGFLDPTKDPAKVRERMERRRAELKGKQFAALYGLDDPVFQQMSDELDGKGVKKSAPAAAPKAGIDEKAAAKAKKKHDAELKHSEQILANMRSQNAQLRAKLAGDDELLTKEKALLQVSKDKTLSDKEKARISKEINKLASEHAGLIKQQKIGEEKEKLSGILSTLKEKSQELRNQLSGQKELNVLLQAEKDIAEAVKVGKKETVKEQEKILAAAKEVSKLEEQLKRQRIDKAIREDDERFTEKIQKEREALDRIGASLKEQNEELRLKLTGQDDLIKKLDLERQYQKDITDLKREEAAAIRDVEGNQDYTGADKAAQIEKIKKGYAGLYDEAEKRHQLAKKEGDENVRLNRALEAQDELLQRIKDSTGSYKNKLAELDAAYLRGDITQKQWKATAQELWKTQTKASSTFGDSIKQIGQSMTTALLNGTKLNDVFKNMAKSLAALAAQKLVFEPLANGIDNLANKLFGTGKYTPQPVMPGSAGTTTAGGSSGGGLGALSPALGLAGGGPPPIANALAQGFNFLGKSTGLPLPTNMIAGGLNFLGRLGIPGFARGGLAAGGELALTGENGPELSVSAGDRYVFSASQTQNLMKAAQAYSSSVGSLGGSGWSAGSHSLISSGWNDLSGGGSVNLQDYLGDWVPQGRRDLLTSIGVSGAGAEVLSLMKAIREEKNNYAKQALNSKLTNALHRRAQEWQGLEAEYRELARAANYAGAQKMVNEETAAGRGEGLAAMAGNAILSNNHISHGIISSGRLAAPRGNAVEDALQAAKLTGKMPSQALLQHLAALDAEAQDDYMPGHFVTPGAGYKSMSDVGRTGGMKVFGVDNAYGGDGYQAALGDMFNALRDERWGNDAQNSYNRSINNKNPLGSYKGASGEYLANVAGWNKFPKNYAGPGANSSITGDGFDFGGNGLALTNGGRIVPTGATGDTNGWFDGEWTGTPNPKPYDPTANPGEIGTIQNFKKMAEGISQRFNEALKKTGLGGMLQGLKNKAGQIIGPGSKAALDAFNSLVRAGGSGAKELAGDLKSSLGSWDKGDFALNMGGLKGDLKSSAGSWAYKGKGIRTGGLMSDLKSSAASWMPKPAPYNGLFGTGPLFGDGDLKGLAAYSGPMLYPAMGIAMPPSIKAMTGRPPASPQPFRGALSPYADQGYRDLFVRQYGGNTKTVGGAAFSRWQTDPYTAGRIHAKLKFRGAGGMLQAGESAVVGEAGREMITAHRPVHVTPAGATGPGGVTVKVEVKSLPGYSAEVTQAANGNLTITQVRKMMEADAARYPSTNNALRSARS